MDDVTVNDIQEWISYKAATTSFSSRVDLSTGYRLFGLELDEFIRTERKLMEMDGEKYQPFHKRSVEGLP